MTYLLSNRKNESLSFMIFIRIFIRVSITIKVLYAKLSQA